METRRTCVRRQRGVGAVCDEPRAGAGVGTACGGVGDTVRERVGEDECDVDDTVGTFNVDVETRDTDEARLAFCNKFSRRRAVRTSSSAAAIVACSASISARSRCAGVSSSGPAERRAVPPRPTRKIGAGKAARIRALHFSPSHQSGTGGSAHKARIPPIPVASARGARDQEPAEPCRRLWSCSG
jgi:hypothetical protein